MSNLQAREALEQARRTFLETPSAARKRNAGATAVWRDGLACEITGPSGERAVTDMPAPLGGKGTGPNPGWLLRASMASCTATAIAMRAALLGIELRTLEVNVESESDARGLAGIDGISMALADIRMTIRLGADNVPGTELHELAMWAAAQSPVSCTLRERPPVAVDVTVV